VRRVRWVRGGSRSASDNPANRAEDTLLGRGAHGDVAEAEAAIERLAAAPADDRLVVREICLLRLRALLARAQSDETAYRDYRDRYHAIATSLGFEGHMKWAEAMP
jgi:adenylate cyclase